MDRMFIACLRKEDAIKDKYKPPEGSEESECRECGAKIIVSPKTKELQKETKLALICAHCMAGENRIAS